MTKRDIIPDLIGKMKDKHFIKNQVNKRILGGVYYNYLNSERGVDLMEQDWDTLLILDACRYDTFLDVKPNTWPEVEQVRSRAPNTWEFYQENFRNGPYTDTVVVTANPRTVKLRGDEFHNIIKAYERAWDHNAGTVLPEDMSELTIEAHELYPNKRILSHWIQPHYPFIGSDAFEEYTFNEESIWADVNRGLVDPDEIYDAYLSTLKVTLPYIEGVFSTIEGRIVVTSDHGNAFGERPWFYPFPIYGHPRSVYLPCLVDVPWMVVDNGPRRKIKQGKATRIDIDDEAEDRLTDLGYIN